MNDNSDNYYLSYRDRGSSTSRSANDRVHHQKSVVLRATDKEDKAKITDSLFCLDCQTKETFLNKQLLITQLLLIAFSLHVTLKAVGWASGRESVI